MQQQDSLMSKSKESSPKFNKVKLTIKRIKLSFKLGLLRATKELKALVSMSRRRNILQESPLK